MKHAPLFFFAVIGGSAPPAVAQIPCRYEVSAIIQAPPCAITGSPPTAGLGISPNGRYVCGYWYGCDDPVAFTGFLFDTTTHQLTPLPKPPGIDAIIARGVNDTPWVVGEMSGSAGRFGFVYNGTTGQYIAMIPPVQTGSGQIAVVNAITSTGVACGTRTVSISPLRNNAFLWSASQGTTDLGLYLGSSTSGADLNSVGCITGSTFVNGVNTPFLWCDNVLVPLQTLAQMMTFAWAMNSNNVVVGQSLISNTTPPPATTNHAVLWDPTGLWDLGTLVGHGRSVAEDIADDGLVVGLSRQLNVEDRGVIWRGGQIFDINALISPSLGLFVEGAYAIAAQGDIVVAARNAAGSIFAVVMRPTISPQGDVNHNCIVDVDDLLMVINQWGLRKSPADINNDGIVNIDDLFIVILNWTVW